MTLLIAGIAIAIGGRFIALAYGPAFAHVDLVVILLAVGVPIIPLGTMSASLLRGMGALRWLTILGVGGALLNVALAFAFVSPFGAEGAATANTLAQVAGGLPLLFYASRRLGGVPLPLAEILRGGFTAAGAAATAYFAAHAVSPALGVLVGFIVFLGVAAVGSVLLQVGKPEDREWLRGMGAQALRRFRRTA
jgi:O-antigen/teichoic acid export membrane protein